MSRKHIKMSFDYCGETCPELDASVYDAYNEISEKLSLNEDQRKIVFNVLIEDYLEKFKNVGTHLLRDALNSACENIIDLEDKIDELEYEVKNS